MKCQIPSISTLALVLALGAATAPAQNSTSSVPLGDLARQLKAQRAKSGEKSKVFTNDSLATLSPSSPTTKEGKPEEKPAKGTAGSEAEKESAKATPAKTGEEEHGEQYYRDRMSKLQDRLEIHQRELDVLQQKLGQSQMMYYPDPYKALLQESGPTAMSDIHKLQDQIAKKKAEIDEDQKAIEDLREQLRREGGDAGWLR
jgi:predicted RNase H-like nuclease (RuvC/YqgF family)